MNAIAVIAKRRDGGVHTPEELAFIANGAADGSIPDYQLSAWLMAAYLNPISAVETAQLAVAMAGSGKRMDLSKLPSPRLDKHSTGGVGDKTTIVLLPLLAACGVTMVKMSGPGLGITGGTVDKLSSIPGFRMDLSPEEMLGQAEQIGLAVTGQTPELAPADKALYALRDVTGTVGSLSLIVSSILSKKLASGAERVLLDVKCGSGGFMPTLEDARALSTALRDTAHRVGLRLAVVITDMDQPLGHAVGNAVEVKEAFRVLRGAETGRFCDLCLTLAGIALELCGVAASPSKGRDRAESALSSGAALVRARDWIHAQAGDASVLKREDWQMPKMTCAVPYSGSDGIVHKVDARAVGQAVVDLGGGRKKKGDLIDPTVGVVCHVEVGKVVVPGDVLFSVLAGSIESANAAKSRLAEAVEVGSGPEKPRPVILEVA